MALGSAQPQSTFVDLRGNPAGDPSLVVSGPLAKLDFFIGAWNVGEHVADVASPGSATGYMAHPGYTGGGGNRHRRGRGQFFVCSREGWRQFLQRISSRLALPETEDSTQAAEWLETVDKVRETNYAAYAAWFEAALRGSVNLAVFSYLYFPRR